MYVKAVASYRNMADYYHYLRFDIYITNFPVTYVLLSIIYLTAMSIANGTSLHLFSIESVKTTSIYNDSTEVLCRKLSIIGTWKKVNENKTSSYCKALRYETIKNNKKVVFQHVVYVLYFTTVPLWLRNLLKSGIICCYWWCTKC